MKRKVLIWMTAAMVVLAGSAAWATPTINISELTDRAPNVTFSNDFPGLGPLPPFTAREYAMVMGTLTTNFIPTGWYVAVMLENGLEPGTQRGDVSDFLILQIDPICQTSQDFYLRFWSEGAATWNDGVQELAALLNQGLPANAKYETGDWQRLLTLDGLIINARSDAVPLPASVLLLGSGLLGMTGFAFRRRNR